MADIIDFKFDDKDFRKALDKFPEKVFKEYKKGGQRVGRRFTGLLVKRRLSGRPGLKRRSGDLARSFRSRVTGNNLDNLILLIFTASKYAPIQEKGGIVTAKRAKMLAIPLAPALTSAGVARYKSPRDMNLRVTMRGGKIFLETKTAKSELMYVLKKSVIVPARLGMFKLWERQLPVTAKILVESVNKAIDKF